MRSSDFRTYATTCESNPLGIGGAAQFFEKTNFFVDELAYVRMMNYKSGILNIQHADIQGVALNELSARFDLIPH